jgi:hypothetical protein
MATESGQIIITCSIHKGTAYLTYSDADNPNNNDTFYTNDLTIPLTNLHDCFKEMKSYCAGSIYDKREFYREIQEIVFPKPIPVNGRIHLAQTVEPHAPAPIGSHCGGSKVAETRGVEQC